MAVEPSVYVDVMSDTLASDVARDVKERAIELAMRQLAKDKQALFRSVYAFRDANGEVD